MDDVEILDSGGATCHAGDSAVGRDCHLAYILYNKGNLWWKQAEKYESNPSLHAILWG